MKKYEQLVKSNLKNKVSITKAVIITLLLTGGINVANVTNNNTLGEASKIFKESPKAKVDKSGLANATNKYDNLNSGHFNGFENREQAYKKLINMSKKIIKNNEQSEKELLDMQQELDEALESVNDGNIVICEGTQAIESLSRLLNNYISSMLNNNVSSLTYYKQMRELSKIVDKKQDKSANTPNLVENIYNYNITNIGEEHGLELGDNSYARGKDSIVTSNRGIAIGNGAVASGDNNNGQTIKQKLKENEDRLNEIAQKQKEERETIEAGIRVEEIKKAKAKAYKEYERLKNGYDTLKNGSEKFFKTHQAKIDDLNSRLTGVGNLVNKDISSPQGLEKAVDEFKEKVENGTSLNLSKEFYKDYIQSYYKALGDLRENKIKQSKAKNSQFLESSDNIDNSIKSEDIKNRYFVYYERINTLSVGYYMNHNFLNTTTNIMYKNIFKNNKTKPNENLKYYDIEKEVLDENTYNKYKENVPLFKAAFREYFNECNDPRLSPEFKEKLYKLNDAKLNIWEKRAEIVYLQGKYEETKNTNFLDKKKKAMDELDKMTEFYKKTFENDEYSIYENNYRYHNKWVKENIDDIMEKNKITTDKLTDELEKALGINKNAIKEREDQLNRMKEEYEQALKNADGMNLSEKDLILAREYERVKKELEQLNKDLLTADARLKALKDGLTLHDLKNIGKDNIAYGTDSLAIDDNALAFGTKASAIGKNSIAIGYESTSVGENTQSIGTSNVTKGNSNTVLGNSNITYGNSNKVLGDNNKIGTNENPINNNFVIGNNITLNQVNNAIVLGNESKGISDAISVGNEKTQRQIKYVAAGTDDTDVVNVSQLKSELSKINKGADKELIKKVQKNTENITNNTNNITNLDNRITTNTTNITTNKTDVDGLKVKVEKNITEISTNRTNIKANKDEIENLKKSIKNGTINNANITKLEKKVTENTTNIKDLSDRTTANENNITNLQTNIKNKINSTDLSIKGDKYITVKNKGHHYNLGLNEIELNKAINNSIKTNIDTNLGDINNKITNNTNSIKDLDNKITTNKNNISNLQKEITNKLNKDGSNLDKDSKNKLITKLSEGANILKPTNTLVTDTQVNNFFNNKFKDFSIDNKVLKDMNYKIDIANAKSDLALEQSNIAMSGVANAVAMANLPQVASYGKYRHMLTAAYGNFNGQNALAIGFTGTNKTKRFTYKISAAGNNRGDLAFGVGAGIMLGEVNTVDENVKVKNELIKAHKERQEAENKINTLESKMIQMQSIIEQLQKELKGNSK